MQYALMFLLMLQLQLLFLTFRYQLESDEEITFNQQPAPRLFCDICDVFDDHDTDDCPLQAQTSESPLPSMHHGNRHADRPYCENCESEWH